MADQSKRTLYNARKSALWSERSSFFGHWQELSQYLLPRSGRFLMSDRNRGDKRYNKIYDNTGTRSLRVLSAGLMAGMTSPARPWFRLATRDKDLMKFGPVKQWLDDTTELMRLVFNVSNTYRALHSTYEELACFGTGVTMIMDDFDDVIRHYPLTVGEYAIATNSRQEVDTIYREFEMTVAQIVREFGLNNVSQQVKNLYDTGKGLDNWIPVIHVIEPRADRDPRIKDAKNMAFASCFYEANGTEEYKYLRESGFKRFPVLAPRWDAKSGDAYGTTCPGMEALGDIKQLQHGQLRKAQGIDYMVKPPIQAPASAKNREIDTLPGGVSFTDMTGPNGGIKTAFDVRLDLSGQLEDIREVSERIAETFYAPLFNRILSDTRSGTTATEIQEIREEKMTLIGPVVERLHNELLKQKIEITFEKMLAAGIVPPAPEEMHGQELNVEFVSVLAQAQRAIGAQNTDRFVQSLGMVAQYKPGILDKFDEDAYADKMADDLGVDPDLIIGNDKVALIRKERAKQQAEAAMQQHMAAAVDTAKNASQINTANMGDVMQGLTGYT